MRYTMDELIQGAKEGGFGPTRRMVQDWVELGLLDRPERPGRGRGKGRSATWSEEQRGLLLALLDHRQRVNRVATLCNVPVWTWLYFGDDYVPLRQVRRALATWEGRSERISPKDARRAAQQLLGLSASPSRSQRMLWLRDEVATILYRLPRRFDAEDEARLLEALPELLDPQEGGLARTVGGMEFTPEAYVEILKARLRASQALAEDTVEDSLFHWARYSNVVSRTQYHQHLVRMTGDSARTAAAIPVLAETGQRACLDLVTLLGFGLGMARDVGDRPLENPIVWKTQNLRSIVRGEQIGDTVRVTVETAEGAVGDETADP